MNKKVLIVYATAGIGHKKAAMAVKEAYDEMKLPGTEVTLIDALDYTNDFFKWSYLQAYLLMVNKLPTLWGLLYYLTDIPFIDLFVSVVRRISNWANSKRLVNYILDTKPDVIISTHFFASEVIADLKHKSLMLSRLVTIVTDYRLHAWWVCEGTDAYIVASDDTRRDLEGRKVDPAKIKVMGIPIEPVFSKPLDKPKIFKETGLRDDLFTILVVGGGFGMGPIEGIVRVIAEIPRELQTVVVCGHNEELAQKIQSLKDEYKLNMKVLGFIDNVYEYMDISDTLISKSGGITVSESLAKEIPLVVISPILGQETGNSAFLVRNNAAVKVKRLDDLKAALEGLISDPVKLDKMKEAIKRIEKPNAAYDVAKFAYEYDK
ncbi:MAG: glycosyltransferase [Candidatus Omnitrophica bacterium]|nr:glycosyltransferase [Candidatus Omnitrophota bacterium]